MTTNGNQSLVCVGQMLIHSSDGTQPRTVPVYKVVSSDDTSAHGMVKLALNERLVRVGVMESKAEAEKRYNTLMAGGTPLKSHITLLYIKENADNVDPESGLAEDEKRTLNSLVNDLCNVFSAAMSERNNGIDKER